MVEILNEDGSMARLPDLIEIGQSLGIKIITIKDLVAYRMQTERLVTKELETEIQTPYGKFSVKAFRQMTTGDIHLAFSIGQFHTDEPTLVRVHSSTETGDILGILFDGYADQLTKSLQLIAKEGKGILLFMRHGEKTESILDKLRSLDVNPYNNPATSDEQRDFGTGAQILREMGISKIKLITNHEKKRVGLIGYGLEIVENIHI